MKRLIILIVLATTLASFAAITTQTWTLGESTSKFWGGVGRDWEGNIYLGLGNHRTDDLANSVVYRFNFTTGNWDQIFDVKSVSQAQGNWLALDRPGKIHSTIKQGVDGKMYFVTHAAFDTDNDIAIYPTSFRGGHFYSYDPVTGLKRDISAPNVGAWHQGITDLAIAPQCSLVYGIGYPNGYMYKQNIFTGDTTMLKATGDGGGRISRIVLEDNYGRFLYPSQKRFIIYNPRTDSTRFGRFRHPYGMQITAAAKSWTGDSIYYMMIEAGNDDPNARMYRYIVSRDTGEMLGYVDSGNTSFKASLAIRWDQNKLYFALGNRLISLNYITKQRTIEATNLPNSGWYGCNGVDKNGDLYFTPFAGRSVTKVSLGSPCALCSTKPLYLDAAYVDSVSRTVVEKNDPGENEDAVVLSAIPNPFNPQTRISVSQKSGFSTQKAIMRIFDVSGSMVFNRVLNGSDLARGVEWSAAGRASGIYVVTVLSGNRFLSKKATLLK